MASKAETPEFAAVKMVDEGKICNQFGTVVDKASLGQMQKFENGNNLPLEPAENFTGAEEHEVAQCFENGTEGKVGNIKTEGLLESPLVAKIASGETPNGSKDAGNESVPVLIKNLELQKEMRIHEDQTNDTAEVTADIIKGDNTEACGLNIERERKADMLNAPVEDCRRKEYTLIEELGKKEEELTKIRSDTGEDLRKKINELMEELIHEKEAHRLSREEGKAARKALEKKLKTVKAENAKLKYEATKYEMANKPEQSAVLEVQPLSSHAPPQVNLVKCSTDNTCNHLLTETNEKSTDSKKEDDSNNAIINATERFEINNEEASEQLEKEKSEVEKNYKKELASDMDREELDYTNDPGNSMDETPIKEVNEVPKIVELRKDTDRDLNEEGCTVKNCTTIFDGEQEGYGSTDGANKAMKREGEVDGLETVDADKDKGDPIIEEDFADHSTATVGMEEIQDGNKEDKVIGGLQIDNVDSDIQHPAIEEDGVPDYSTRIIGEQTTTYVHEEKNAIGGLEIFDAEKEVRDQENVATVLSAISIKEKDAIKDGSVEEKVIRGVGPVVDDKEIGEEEVSDQFTTKFSEKLNQEIPDEILGSDTDEVNKETRESIIQENFVPRDSLTSTTSMKEKLIIDGHDEVDTVTEGLDVANGDKCNAEPLTEDDVVSNHSTKIINDIHEEDKVNKGPEILSADSDIKDPIIEEDFPVNSMTTTGEEPIQEQQEEGNVIEEIDAFIPENAIGKPVVENIVGPDDSTMIIEDEAIIAGQNKNKVTEGLRIIDADKHVEDAIIAKNGVQNSKTTSGHEATKDDHQQDKVCEGLETINAPKEFGVPVTVENVVIDHSTPPIKEAIKDDNEEDKVTQGKEIIDAEISDKHRKQLVVKETVDLSPPNIEEKAIENDNEEDRITGELDTSATHEAIVDLVGDPIIEENVVSDNTTATIMDEPIKDDQEEDKVRKGLYLVGVDKEIEAPFSEENIVVNNSKTSTGEEAIQDDHVEDKVTEGLETTEAVKDMGNPVTEKNVLLDNLTSDIGAVVTEGKETIAANKDMKQLDIQESADFSPKNIREKTINDYQEEHKGIEGIDASTIHKAIEDTVPPGDSTSIIKSGPIKDGQEEDRVSEGLHIVDADKQTEEVAIEENGDMTSSTTDRGEEASKDDHIEDNVTEELQTADATNDIWAPFNDENIVLDHSTTISMEEEIKDDNGKATEHTEITEADKDVTQLITMENILLTTTNVGEKIFEDTHEEHKGTEGLEIVDEIEDTGESLSEENVPLHNSNTTTGEEIIKDNQEEDKVSEDLEIVGVMNDIQKFGIYQNVVLGHPAATTEEKVIKEDHQEDKATEQLKIADGNKNVTDRVIEKNVDLDHSTATISVAIDDGHEIDKVNEELEIHDADKNIQDSLEENVVLEHFETTVGDASKDGYIEDKVTEKLEIADADKEIGRHVNEESNVHDSTNAGEETINDHEDKINERLEMVCANRDIRMLDAGEIADTDHFTANNGEKAIKDCQEEVKVTEGLEIVNASQKCEAVTEEYAVLDHSTPIGGETTKNGHEDKVTKELEIADADIDDGESFVEENVVADQSTNIITEEVIKDDHEEDKVIEVVEIVDAEKVIVESITEKNITLDRATITVEKEATSGAQDDKVTKELEIVDAEMDVGDPIIDQNVVADLSTTITTEEIIKDCDEEEKVTEEFKIIGESTVLDHATITIGEEASIDVQDDKITEGSEIVDEKNDNIGNAITGENVALELFTTIGEETRQDGHVEDKVSDGLIVDAEQDNGEPAIEENVTLGHFTTILREEAVKDDKEDKINEDVDKDIEPIEEIFVLGHSTTTIGEEEMKDSHDEDMVTERLKTVQVTERLKTVGKNKEIGEPKTEENLVQDNSTTTITDETSEESLKTVKVEDLKVDSKDNDIGEPTIKKDVGRDQLTAIVIEDTITSDQKEDKANQGLEVEKPIIEKDVIPDQSTTTIRDEPISDNHEEDKVLEEFKATAEGEVTKREILEDAIVIDLYEKTTGDDKIKGITQEYEVCVDNARAEDVKQIEEDASITELSMISVGEATKENTQEEEMGTKEREGKAKEFDLPAESNFEASNSAQKIETIMSRDEEQNSEELSDTWTEKIETTNITSKTEMVNSEDVEDLQKSQGVYHIKEIAEEEIIYEGRREMLDGTLVPHMFEEQKNEDIIERKEGNDKRLGNVFVKEETKWACLQETKSEGTQLIELSDELHKAASIADTENTACEKEHGSTMNLKECCKKETTKTELIHHLGDHGDQNKEVVSFSDLSSLKENFKPVDLNEENKWFGLESPDNNNNNKDGSSTTCQLLDSPANEVSNVLTNDKVQKEDGEIHETKLSEMSEGPEPTVSKSHQVEITDGAITHVKQSETESMKLKKTGESHSIEVLKDTDAKDNSDKTRTNKDKPSSTNFGTDAVEGEVTPERNKAKYDDTDDQGTVLLRDEAVGQSCSDDEKEQQNIELYSILEDENPGIISNIQYKKVCEEPKIADQRENSGKVKEEAYIAEGNTSAYTEDTIYVNPEEEIIEARQLHEEVCEEADYTKKEIRHNIDVNENSIYTFEEVIASKNSHIDEKVPKTPGEEVEESDSISKEGEVYSAKQTEIVPSEEIPKKSLDAFTALETITKMEASTLATMCEETAIEEILEKTDSNHENIAVALLPEKLSLNEAEPESRELVDSSDHASMETFSTTMGKIWASPQDPDVEDLKHTKNSNPTDDTFRVGKNSAAFEQEKSNIPVEASIVGIQSDIDTEISPVEEITAVKPSSDDISYVREEESRTLASATHEFNKTGTREKIKDDFLIESEVIDEKMEAFLQAHTEGEMYMQMEEHMKLNEDSVMGIENTQKFSNTKLDAEKLVSEQKDSDVNFKGEKFFELNKLSLEILDIGLEQNKFKSEERSDAFPVDHEATGTCTDIKTDILEKEDSIKRLDDDLEESKMHMKVEGILEAKTTEHSHEINESYNITEDMTLAQENLKNVDPNKVLNRVTKSVDQHQSCSVPATETADVVKDENIMKDRNVVPFEDHTVRQNTKDEEKENDHQEEVGPKLAAGERNGNTKVIVMDGEMHHGVERENKSEKTEIQSVEEEAFKAVEVLVDNTSIQEVEDSDFICTDKDNEATYCSERTETETSGYVEELNIEEYANTDTEASKELHNKDDSEEHEDVFKVTSEVYQDNVIKEIKQESHVADIFHIQPVTVITDEKSDKEAIVDGFSTPPEEETSKVAETVNTGVEEDSIEKMSLGFVSQLPWFGNGSLGQQSVTVDEDVTDNTESGIAGNTEESFMNYQKDAEAILPLEKIELAQLENQMNASNQITSTHALTEETSAEDVGEASKISTLNIKEDIQMHNERVVTGDDITESTDEESEKDQKGAVAIIEKIEPSEIENLQNTTDKIAVTNSMAGDTSAGEVGEYCKMDSTFEFDTLSEGVVPNHDNVSDGDGRVEAIIQEYKNRESINEGNPESEDNQNNKPNEANMETGKLLEEESEVVSDQMIHEIITKTSQHKDNEPNDEMGPEHFIRHEKPSGSMSDTNTMGTMKKMHGEEELLTDNCDIPSLEKATRVQVQEKEDRNTGDDEKQDVVLVKNEENEMSLSAGAIEENMEHEIPVVKMLKEGLEKTKEFSDGDKMCTHEEEETQHEKQPNIPQGSNVPDQSAKTISTHTETTGRIDKKLSVDTLETPSMPKVVSVKSLLAAGAEEAKGDNSEENRVECETDKRIDSLDEEANGDSVSSEVELPLLDLLHEPKKNTDEAVAKYEEEQTPEETENKLAPTGESKDGDKTGDEDKAEEINTKAEENEQKNNGTGSDAPMETSMDKDMNTTPKKAQNMLSGVGSKVKHSISKVKKAITGKPSQSKQLSPK